jgi:hypothetical protein
MSKPVEYWQSTSNRKFYKNQWILNILILYLKELEKQEWANTNLVQERNERRPQLKEMT